MRTTTFWRNASSFAIAIGLATSAGAQDAGDKSPDEIIVTARKKAESLQSVPLAIKAFTEEAIEREGIREIEDIARKTPGLTFDIGGFPNDTRPALRGMQAERGRPSVAVLLDGQDLTGENLSIAGGTASLNGALFDIERIEVVKGPQSTLYGRNAFAGAINYVSNDPKAELEGKFGGEVGNGGLTVLQGMVNVPLGSMVGLRLTASRRETDGFYTNPVNGGKLGAERNDNVGAAVLIQASDDLKVIARYRHSKDTSSDSPTAFIAANTRLTAPGSFYSVAPGAPSTIPCPATITALTPAQQANCTRGTVVGPITAGESNIQMGNNPITGKPPFGMRMNQNLGSLDVTWVQEWGTLSYRLGILDNASDIEQDGDFTNFAGPPGAVLSLSVLQSLHYENSHTDHEVRYQKDWKTVSAMLGAQKFTEDSSLINSAQFWLRNPASTLAGPPFLLATAPLAVATFPVVNSRDTHYTGLFGGISWQATDQFKVSAEARYNRDKIDYTMPGFRRQDVSLSRLTPACLPQFANGATFSATAPATTPPPGVVAACPRTASLKYNEVTPRGTIEFKPAEGKLIYGSVSKGFKPGGFNTNEVFDFTGQGYRPEKVIAYELGTKTSWLDRTLIINADIYYNDYTDQQIGVQNSLTSPTGQVVTTAGIVNAGKVEVKGFEADVDWRATENLRLSIGYAYTDAEFKEYVQGPPPGSAAAAFTACGVPAGQTSSDQNRAEAGNACADFSGKKVGKSPKHAINLSAAWRQDFSTKGSWFVEGSAMYRSKRFLDEANLAYLGSYWRAGARAGVEFDAFSFTGYVENIFDNRDIESTQRLIDFGRPEGFAPGRGYIAYLPHPRTYGIRGEWRF